MSTSSPAEFPPASVIASSIAVASSRVTINAPAALVFDLLIDPTTWPHWNAFVPRAVALPSQAPAAKMKEGDKLRFSVHMPKTDGEDPERQLTTSDVQVTLIREPPPPDGGADAPKIYSANWRFVNTLLLPSWALNTQRYNEVEVLGEAECVYRTWEEFNGVAAYAIKFAALGGVERGFIEWGKGLKKAAEERWEAQKGSKG